MVLFRRGMHFGSYGEVDDGEAGVERLFAAVQAAEAAGFDVIYACQDYDFDCEEGLFSIPRKLGIAGALLVARLLHAAMIGCLLCLAYVFHLNTLSFAGIASVVPSHAFRRISSI